MAATLRRILLLERAAASPPTTLTEPIPTLTAALSRRIPFRAQPTVSMSHLPPLQAAQFTVEPMASMPPALATLSRLSARTIAK